MTRERTKGAAAIYCRISHDTEGDALGVERQRADCLRLVERNNWAIVPDGENDTFTDNDISGGKDFTERAAFGRLVAAVTSGEVDAVVAYTQARIYRDTAKFLEFCGLLKEYNVETLALVSDADVNPAGSLFVATIIAAKDAEERRRIAELGARKHLELAQKGKYHGGSRPFGFEKDGVTHNPVEAELIREATARILKGESLHAIRRDWEERKVKTTTGKTKWSVSTLKRVMVSPRTAGLRQHKDEILEGVETEWDPIIDRETWESICAILNNPARFTGVRTGNYPLNGLLWCALCEEPLKAMPRQGTRCYGCKKDTGGCGRIHVRSEKIEDYLFNVLLPMADSPGMRNVLRAEGEGGDKRIQELLVARAEDQAALEQLDTDFYVERIISQQRHRKQSERLEKRMEAVEAQLMATRGNTALTKLGGEIQSSWETLSPEDKRLVLASIAKRIEVGPAPTPGSNRFDPARIKIQLRSEVVAKVFVGPLKLTRYVL